MTMMLMHIDSFNSSQSELTAMILSLAKQALVTSALLSGRRIRETERLTRVHRDTICRLWHDLLSNYDNADELRSAARWYCLVDADQQTAAMRAGDATEPWSMEVFVYAHRNLPRSMDPSAKPSIVAPRPPKTPPAVLPLRCPMRLCHASMVFNEQDGVYRCVVCEGEFRPGAKRVITENTREHPTTCKASHGC